LDAVVGLIGSRFARSEPRARVGAYVRGLLAGLERKNGWTLAEHAGAVSPDGMQRLLRSADWDVDGVRDDVRGYVLDGLADPDPDPGEAGAGVFIADDTGFIKKGHLCRRRHKVPYADLRIMPTSFPSVLVSWGRPASLVGIMQAL